VCKRVHARARAARGENGQMDMDGRLRRGEEKGENEESCLWFVRQCKPAFSYRRVVSIVLSTMRGGGGLLVITRATEQSLGRKAGRRGFIRRPNADSHHANASG